MASIRPPQAGLPAPPVRVADGVWQLLLPQPYHGPVYAYLIEDERLTLVDCGHGAYQELLVQALALTGHRLEELDLILYTHPHLDHAGGSLTSHPALGAVRCGSAWTLPPPAMAERFRALPAIHAREVPALGAVLTGPATAEFMAAYCGYSPPVPLDRVLADGDEVRLGRTRLVALATPGHSHDHLAFLDPERGICFCGDLILDSGPALDVYLDSDVDQFLASLERVAAIPGLTRLLPGHGRPLPPPPEAAGAAAARLQRRNRAILEFLGHGWAGVYEILLHVYRQIPARAPWLLISMLGQVVTQLDWLVRRGEVTVRASSEGRMYRSANF